MTQVQHYVPRFLLRNFSVPLKNSQIFVFDKHTGRSFTTNIKNVASETGFYDIDINKNQVTLEPALIDLDNETSVVINQIVKDEKLPEQASRKRLVLAEFVTVQFLRVKRARKEFVELDAAMASKLESVGPA